MTIDPRLIELLVCPLCKGALTLARGDGGRPIELHCAADRLAYPIRDGIPLMLDAEARALDATASPAPPAWPFTGAATATVPTPAPSMPSTPSTPPGPPTPPSVSSAPTAAPIPPAPPAGG